ncbi:MAG: hypothetical protein ACXVLT_13145 [Flavisolibacter sp.]
MRILDIDLDFFLNDKAHSSVTSTNRLDEAEYIPWQRKDVKCFLENNCGLNSDRRIPGKKFIHHIEVFNFLRSLQEQNKFQLQFSIDHVDAHADLGMGDSSFVYISAQILTLPLRGQGLSRYY